MEEHELEWLRSMGIDPDKLPEDQFGPGSPTELPALRHPWHEHARAYVRGATARRLRLLTVPVERRRMGRFYAERLEASDRLSVFSLDDWDDGDRRHMLEIHSDGAGFAPWSGPSCDLHLRWTGSQFYRRAQKRWDAGAIGPSPYASYA